MLLYFQGGKKKNPMTTFSGMKKKNPHTTRSITVVASYHVIVDPFYQKTPKNKGTKVSLKNGIYF
jgi:hypothetical protein